MREYYEVSSCSRETYLRAADEFGFDIHCGSGLSGPVAGLHCRETYDLPDVAYHCEERTEGEFRVCRRTFETPEGTLTDDTWFPPSGDRRYGISPNPFRKEHLVKSPADLKALPYLVVRQPQVNIEAFRRTESTIGERGLVMAMVYSALCHRAGEACPMQDLMVAFYEDRPFFDEILGLYQEEMMAEVRAYLDAGVRHFVANWYYNSLSAGWSPQIWREAFVPQLREMTDLVHAHGGTVNLYDDGKCMEILDLFAEAQVDVLQTIAPPPMGDVDLAEAKRRIGDRVCLMGYVDLLHVIRNGTPESIERTVKETIRTAAPGSGFILGTSDSIRDGTPLENVRAYFDAARKYGADY